MFNTEQSKRESRIALILIFLCLGCFVLGIFLVKPIDFGNQEKESAKKIVKDFLGDKVSVIALEGVIMDTMISRTPFRTTLNSAYVKNELGKAISDKHTRAVLLRMNSPGGTVAASQEIYELVRELTALNKPVIVSMGDVCASGCYYIASAATKIIANRGTLTGSIGVISQGFNYQGLMEKIGLEDQTFKSGKYKDLASGQRYMTDEERTILQALLDDSYDQFLTDIVSGRGIAREELEEKAQGLIYTGKQAQEQGLVDIIGSMRDAKEELRQVLKEQGYEKYDSIKFTNTWMSSRISSFEDLLDLGLDSKAELFFTKLGLGSIFNKFKSQPSLGQINWDSKFKILWLMQ
jgi:protease IV